MLQWSPDLEDSNIVPKTLYLSSASVRVEMSEEYEASIRSSPADLRTAATQVSSAPFSDGDAGLRDREPLPESSEGQAAAMYERIADYIEEVRTSLRIDVTGAVYTRQRARDLQRTMAARLPGAPTRGPGDAVPPTAAAVQGQRPTGAVTSRDAGGK